MARTVTRKLPVTPEQTERLCQEVLGRAEKILPDGFFVVDVAFTRESGQWVLQVFVETRNPLKDGRISIQDCERISLLLDPELDRILELADWADNLPYNLEVSSPGLNRRLTSDRELGFYRGHSVKALVSGKSLEGILEGFDPATRSVRIQSSDVSQNPITLPVIDPAGHPVEILLNPRIDLPGEPGAN